MHKYKITLEYDGTDYVGWQRQENGNSIQAAIVKAIEKLTLEKATVFGAGRTDAGVHAKGQVAHFDIKKNFTIDNIRDGLNQHLRPQPISIIKVEKVTEEFHARFSANYRIYEYLIVNRKSPLTIEKNMAWIVLFACSAAGCTCRPSEHMDHGVQSNECRYLHPDREQRLADLQERTAVHADLRPEQSHRAARRALRL